LEAATERLNSILAGTGDIVENFPYTYDALSNLLTRADTNTNLTETFTVHRRHPQPRALGDRQSECAGQPAHQVRC
jgi:hypothetical protein